MSALPSVPIDISRRQSEQEQLLELRRRQAQAALDRTLAEYARRGASLRGMLGGYGTLTSGPGLTAIRAQDVEGMRAGGAIAADLNAALLQAQVQSHQFDEQQQLAWQKFLADRAAAESDLALRRELGVGDLGLRERGLAQEAEQAALGREHELGVLGKTQEFQSAEAGKGREFQAAEAGKGREFEAGESALAREQQRYLQEGSQAFQAGESAKGREHELEVTGKEQAFRAGESALSREQERALQAAEQQFRSGESALGREHELGVLGKTQEFTAGESALGREQELAVQQREQAFRSEEAAKSREQESSILATQQGFQAGQATLGREHETQLQQSSQQAAASESALDREWRAVQQDKQLALQERELAARIADNEANRGVQRDEMRLNAALKAVELADRRLEQAQQREMDLAKLAQSGASSAATLLKSGLNPADPTAQQILTTFGVTPPASGGGGRSPESFIADLPAGATQEQQLAAMSNYWQARQQGNRAGTTFFPQATGGWYGGDSELDWYRADTDRLRAMAAGRPQISLPSEGTSAGDWKLVAPDDQRAVGEVMNWWQTGRLPSVRRDVLYRGLNAALESGLLTESQHAELGSRLEGAIDRAESRRPPSGVRGPSPRQLAEYFDAPSTAIS